MVATSVSTAVSTARRIVFCFMICIVKFIIINFKLADVAFEENDNNAFTSLAIATARMGLYVIN